MEIAIYASLMSFALGLFTSMTFLALEHIFIIIPALYFIPKTNFKKFNKSVWFLLLMILAFVVSVLVNQDIAVLGYASLTKMKYYLFAIISIAPISYYFNKLDSEEITKKIHYLLLALFITTTVASISGMMGVWTGFNLLKWKVVTVPRNTGLAGMVLNYAHNLASLQVIIVGMIIYREKFKKYINLNFLYVVFGINLLGLITSYTRGAMLSFLVAIAFYYFKKNIKIFLITILAFVCIAFVGYKSLGGNILRPSSDVERVSMWKAAIVGFKERPIFGLGYLNFEHMSGALKVKYGIEKPDYGGHAHSNYLESLASTGVVGFLFFMLWQISWFIEMYKREDLLAKIAIPFIVAFVVSGLTQATFFLGANLFFIMSFYTLTQINIKILKDNPNQQG